MSSAATSRPLMHNISLDFIARDLITIAYRSTWPRTHEYQSIPQLLSFRPRPLCRRGRNLTEASKTNAVLLRRKWHPPQSSNSVGISFLSKPPPLFFYILPSWPPPP